MVEDPSINWSAFGIDEQVATATEVLNVLV